ncbi:MAG TPA: isoleucine--tRNA ligase [Armatimonadetes bacterium]|nr:isoleucine--tRNA ligase [Armatimonadota bacterium]
MEYRQTVLLPQTPFPQRANLPQREPQWLKFWQERRIYEKSLARRRGCPRFELHDGPPYSNLHIHCGHLLNKVLKDFVVRSHQMAGYYAPFVPGWDNHGLPIEYQVSENLRRQGREADRLTLRRECRQYAAHWVQVQAEEFQRLGVRGDWEHPYLTMSPQFEAGIVEVFAALARKGYIYRGLKVIHWCPNCVTALAEAEIEYEDKASPSIYVAFPVKADPRGVLPDPARTEVVIWTTTPWTIPANLAIAVHPEFAYNLLAHNGRHYLVAQGLQAVVAFTLGWGRVEVVQTLSGRDLEGVVCRHPLYGRDSPLVLAEYVDLEAGTGCVHTAPGHGKEDFETGQKYGLPVLSPVDDHGRFTAEVGERLAGKFVFEANPEVNKWLAEVGALLYEGDFVHNYPHCWRCHQPVIFRATVQWFMNIDHVSANRTHREVALEEIQKVQWVPPEGAARITAMVSQRPDWCLSRQRAWGVGIPVFYCEACGEVALEEATLEAVVRLVRERGSDAWFEVPAKEILPPDYRCAKCGGTKFTKETDILDVWFDSGSTHQVVYPPAERPVEVYLEGSDQHRGWFNSSLMVSVGVDGRAPYKTVITHGFVLDQEGRAMHKSRGNVISPLDLIKDYGADVLRLWVASTDYTLDVRIGDEILKRVADAYRRIRNTFRFLLGNLHDFVPSRDAVPFEQMPPLERWVLHALEELKEKVLSAYREFNYSRIYHAGHNFCSLTLSAGYLDILKDELYCGAPDGLARRAAQTVLYELAVTLAKLLAPILVFTTEEVWQLLPEVEEESVHLTDLPALCPERRDELLAGDFARLFQLRDWAYDEIEKAVTEKRVRQPLEAAVRLTLGQPDYDLAQRYADFLPKFFIVSRVEVVAGRPGEIAIEVRQAPGQKCERCWVVYEEVGVNPRHPTLCARCAQVVETYYT